MGKRKFAIFEFKMSLGGICHIATAWRTIRIIARNTMVSRADSRFALSQWETVLLCNYVSHWLGANFQNQPWWGRCAKLIGEMISRDSTWYEQTNHYRAMTWQLLFEIAQLRLEPQINITTHSRNGCIVARYIYIVYYFILSLYWY